MLKYMVSGQKASRDRFLKDVILSQVSALWLLDFANLVFFAATGA